jgi:hypothetical protein
MRAPSWERAKRWTKRANRDSTRLESLFAPVLTVCSGGNDSGAKMEDNGRIQTLVCSRRADGMTTLIPDVAGRGPGSGNGRGPHRRLHTPTSPSLKARGVPTTAWPTAAVLFIGPDRPCALFRFRAEGDVSASSARARHRTAVCWRPGPLWGGAPRFDTRTRNPAPKRAPRRRLTELIDD